MSFQEFDSLDKFFAEMRAKEYRANAELTVEQRQLLHSTEMCWFVQPTEVSIVVFGEAIPLDQSLADEAKHYDNLDDPEERAEYEFAANVLRNARARGYIFCRCYSVVEPRGELGDVHVSRMVPIPQEIFELAKSYGWQI
jgi:hypothetical protein